MSLQLALVIAAKAGISYGKDGLRSPETPAFAGVTAGESIE